MSFTTVMRFTAFIRCNAFVIVSFTGILIVDAITFVTVGFTT